MSEVYDFRGSQPGQVVVVETDKDSFILTKEADAGALEGWMLADEMGSIAVELVVLDPPFMTTSAVIREGHELGVKRSDEPNVIYNLGENPIITQSLLSEENSAA